MSWDAKLFHWHLKTRRFAREIEHFDELDSTNRWLLQHHARFSTTGAVVVADHQTAGRGRHDRVWFDVPRKSLLFSVLLKYSATEPNVRLLSLLPAVVLGEILRDGGSAESRVEVKWPNDVLINGKKVSGVLGQSSGGTTSIIALGVGVNVSETADDFPAELKQTASSIAAETGTDRPREMLLAEMLNRMEPLYDAILENNTISLRNRWLTLGPAMGTRIVRTENHEVTEGNFAGLGERGELLLRDACGNTQALTSGDVGYL